MDYSRIVTLPGGTKLGLTYDPITNKTLVPDSEIEMLKGTGEVDFRDVITGDDLKRLFGDNVTFVSDEYYSNFLNNLNTPSQMSGLYQTTNPNILGYSPPNAGITAVPQVQEQAQVVEDSNNILDQWAAHAEATQAMKGKTGLPAIPEYGFQSGYDFQSKFPNLDPRIGAGLAAGYQVLTEGLGMFNPNNQNFLNPVATYKTALSDATKNIEGIMAFNQNLITPQQQQTRNRYLQNVGQFNEFVGKQEPTIAQNINETVSNYNPFQQQRYMQFAAENPERAQAAAQQAQEFAMARKR